MKVNLGRLVEQADADWEASDVRIKTRVWVSEIKPNTGRKLGVLAEKFRAYRLGVGLIWIIKCFPGL